MERTPPTRAILIEIGAGELIDRLSILQIKLARLPQGAAQKNVRAELASLTEALEQHCAPSAQLTQLSAELKTVNEHLWDVEDRLRRLEAQQSFGEEFVTLARSVYQQNDKRAALKREINLLTGARRMEEKSYPAY